MVVTTILAYIVARRMWKWKKLAAVLAADRAAAEPRPRLPGRQRAEDRLGAAGLPLVIGCILFLWSCATWVRGSRILTDKTPRDSIAAGDLTRNAQGAPPHRVPGTAIFLTADPEYMAPVALMHNLKHNKVLHEKNVIADRPSPPRRRGCPTATACESKPVSDDFKKVVITLRLHGEPQRAQGAGARAVSTA